MFPDYFSQFSAEKLTDFDKAKSGATGNVMLDDS